MQCYCDVNLGLFLRLYEKGLTVIGIEFVEKAILDFFAENKLDFTATSVPEATLYQVTSFAASMVPVPIFL